MNATITLDTMEFDAAARAYIATTHRDLAEIVNQRALNVAGRAFDALQPRDPVAKRKEINRYMWQQLSQTVKVNASGKRKGKFSKRRRAKDQLARVHLIVQARRAAEGKKGLYGNAMRKVAGKFAQRAQLSVGFLKSFFLPIIVTLNPLCRFKFPFSKTANIARWPNSAGYGRVRAARPGGVAVAELMVGGALQRAGNEPKVQRMLATAIQFALNAEAREMRRHVAEKMGATARKFSSR